MDYSLKDLQLLAEREFTVEDTRKDLTALTKWFCDQPEQEHYLQVAMVNERRIPMATAKEQKVFFVDDEMVTGWLPEEFRSESLGFVRGNIVTFAGRLVYPVMDNKGEVMGFCGWDKVNKPKYLDSHNQGYKAKKTTFYGMEKLPEYYRNNLPVYLPEGIVCCLYLRSKGFQAFAALGSNLTPYVLTILRRFSDRLIVIPDNDTIGKITGKVQKDDKGEVIRVEHTLTSQKTSGESFVQQVKRELPKARVLQSSVAKDIDDTRKADDGKYEEKLLADLKNVAINPFSKLDVLRLR